MNVSFALWRIMDGLMVFTLNFHKNVFDSQLQVPGGQPERRARRLPNVRTQLDGGQDGERGRLQRIQDLKCNTQRNLKF